MVVAGAPLLVAGAAWALHAVLMLMCPFQLDYGEGAALELAAALARGESLYPDPALPPYRISPYAPLYLWLASLLMGARADFFSGRLLSVASAAVLVTLVAVWVGRRRGGLAGTLAAAFLLAHPLLFNWSCLFRVDTLGLALTVGGLILVSSPGPARCLAGGLLLGLAFLTKQSFLAGPLAAGILLASRRRPRELALLALGLGLSAILPALALDRWSGGQLLDLWFRFNAMPYDPGQVLRYWGTLVPSLAALAPLAAAAGADREGRGDLALWAAYALTSFTAAWGAGRFGSFYNYFLELQVALAVLAACGAAWLAGQASALLRAGALALTALQLFWLGPGSSLEYLYAPWLYLRHESVPLLEGRLPPQFTGLLRNGYALGPWLQELQGPILAENLGNPVVWGRLPWLCDPATYFKLAEMGLWDEEPLLRRIDQGFFDVILLQKVEGNIRFPPRVLRRILRSYAQVGRAGVDRVFIPRARARPGPQGPSPEEKERDRAPTLLEGMAIPRG
jgi:hypothetical protein